MDHAANLFVAADDGIEFALAGALGQIEGITLKSLVLRLGILVGDALGSADGLQGVQDRVVGGADLIQEASRRVALALG